ncbi:MAG: type II secretion system F family protein [Dongiaceae bacterium]
MTWQDYLIQSGLTLQDILIVGGITIAALILVAIAFSAGSKQSKARLQRVSQTVRKADALAGAISVRRNTTDSSIKAFDRLIKRWMPNPERMRRKLACTGRKISLGQFLLVCLLLGGMVTAAVAYFGIPWIAAILAGMTVGGAIPYGFVSYLAANRQKKFNDLFPDAIDLIVRGLKSGLPISESIRVVGTEITDPVGVEFRQVSDHVKFGKSLTEALWIIARNIDTPEFRFFIISLTIQQDTGGNLAETLENLGGIVRRRKQMKLKIRAFSSEAKASAYIIGSLPFVMFAILMMMNPGYASQLYTDPRGILLIGAGLTSYAIGIGVMAKMVRFDI